MTNAHQIILYSVFFLCALTCSITLPVIPGQAQQQNTSNATGKPESNIHLSNKVGTVRINTICNLEKIFCITAPILQYGAIVGGAILIWHSRVKLDLIIPIFNLKLTRRTQLIIGCGLAALGFAFPAILNWLIQG